MLLHSSLTLAALILVSLAAPGSGEDQQASGGTAIERTDYMWFSAIGEGSNLEKVVCSGALISARHVVTANHCLDDRVINSLWVRVGHFCPRSHNCGRRFRVRNVIEIRRDPSIGDIAILVLNKKAPSMFVPAIPDVASPSYLSRIKKGDEMLMVVGAGRDGASKSVGNRTETLKLQLQHKSHKRCRKAISSEAARKEFVFKPAICSISDEGKPCEVDSGSPILFVDRANMAAGDVIVAIHNYGPSDCSGADNELLFGHVAVNAVSDFVIGVVCLGNARKETWCPPTPPAPTPPSASPAVTAEDCTPFISADTCTPFISADTCAPFVSADTCMPFVLAACTPSQTLPSMPSPTPNNITLNGETLRATLRHSLTGDSDRVFSVAFDATSSRLAAGVGVRTVNIWDLRNEAKVSIMVNDISSAKSVAFNPSGTLLAVDDGFDIALLTVQNSKKLEVRKLQGHTNYVCGVAWHPVGRMLASGGFDTRVKLWDVFNGNILHTFRGHFERVNSVSFHPRGQYLASASSDKTIRIWDISNMSHVRTLQGHTFSVHSVAYSPNSSWIASGSWDGTIRIWRASDGTPLHVFSVDLEVSTVSWSPDSQFVVSGSDDGVVHIWDVNTEQGEALVKLEEHSDWVESVAWSLNGKWIASGSWDNTIKIWEINS